MKRILLPLASVLISLPIFGQAAVESAILHGNSAAAAAGAANTGKAAAGILGNVGKIAAKAGEAAATNSTRPTNVSPPKGTRSTYTPPPKTQLPKPVDPAAITTGLTRSDLLSRFGPPSMRITDVRNGVSLETLWYATTTKGELRVELESGTVTRVHNRQPPPPLSPKPD